MNEPQPTPQPVLKVAITQAAVLKVLLAVAIITRYLGWWSPSADDLVVLAGALTELVSDVVLVVAWFVHNRVTPVAKVALTKDDVALLEAANDPQTPIGMGLLRDSAQIARDRVPPLKGTP